MSTQLIDAPETSTSAKITQLGYVEAYDAVLNDDYACVAYKEEDTSGGAWRVRIRSRHTAGAVFEPEAMRREARAAGAQGKPYFVWGFSLDPSTGDPRKLQFRVHVKDGKPGSIEMMLQTRKADGSADEMKTISFPWPA